MCRDKLTSKTYICQLTNIPEMNLINFNVTLATKKHENYCGTLNRLEVTSENGKQSFIIKTLPVGEFALKYVLEAKLFERETMFYTKTLPSFKQLCDSKFDLDFSPNGYNTSKRYDVIVIDDLCYQPIPYVIADRSNRLNYDHCDVSLKALVKLHVLSWVQASTDLDEFLLNYKDGIYIDKNKNYVLPYLECSLACLRSKIQSWNIGQRYVNYFDKFLTNLWNDLKRVIEPIPLRNGQNLNVLNHGDFWANNIMFQYDTKLQEMPVNAKLVDFQNLRFCSPVLDLLYFYHSSVQENISYDQLLENYYKYFKDILYIVTGRKDNMPFDLDFLKTETEDKKFFGFFATCTVLQSVLSKPVINDVDTDELSINDVKNTNESPLHKMYDGNHFKSAFLHKLFEFVDSEHVNE